MKLELLLFASLKEELGPRFPVEIDETSPGASDVRTLRGALRLANPAFARLGPRLLVAVNERYAREEDPIRAGDTVALLPPIAGG